MIIKKKLLIFLKILLPAKLTTFDATILRVQESLLELEPN